jgi:hypothetical protein
MNLNEQPLGSERRKSMSMKSMYLLIDAWLYENPELTRQDVLATTHIRVFAGYAQSTIDRALGDIKRMVRIGMTPKGIRKLAERQWGR